MELLLCIEVYLAAFLASPTGCQKQPPSRDNQKWLYTWLSVSWVGGHSCPQLRTTVFQRNNILKIKELKKQGFSMIISFNGDGEEGSQGGTCGGKLGHTEKSQMATHRMLD